MPERLINRWTQFWMKYAGLGPAGKAASWLAGLLAPPYYGRTALAELNPRGYISPKATIYHSSLKLGAHIFVGDHVLIYRDHDGGPVNLSTGVHLYRDTIIQTGEGGSLSIGEHTHIQPRCQFSAYKSPIQIGNRVEIAPNCAFYSYDHGIALDRPVRDQPLQTKGGIIVGDEAWLGVGVIVLDGVRIGKGAVIGAGSVVARDVPDNAVAFGVPARVVKMRN